MSKHICLGRRKGYADKILTGISTDNSPMIANNEEQLSKMKETCEYLNSMFKDTEYVIYKLTPIASFK